MKQKLINAFFYKIAFFVFGIFTLALTGCLDSKKDDPAPEPRAYISFFHGSPDAPDLDIHINSMRVFNQAIKYTDFTRYIGVTPGSLRIKFSPVNAVSAYVDTAFTFREDKVYSLFVVDRVDKLDVVMVKDSLVAPASGKVRVRIINLSPDAPAVDLVSSGTTTTSLFTNVGFKQHTEFKELTAGTQSFQIKSASSGEVLLPVPNVALEKGRIYTFALRGFVNPPTGNSNRLSLQAINNF